MAYNNYCSNVLFTLLLLLLVNVKGLYGELNSEVSLKDRMCFRFCNQNLKSGFFPRFNTTCTEVWARANDSTKVQECTEICEGCPNYCSNGRYDCDNGVIKNSFPDTCYLFCKKHRTVFFRKPPDSYGPDPAYKTTCAKVDNTNRCRDTCASCPEWCMDGFYTCPDSWVKSEAEYDREEQRRKDEEIKPKDFFIGLAIVGGILLCCYIACGLALGLMCRKCSPRPSAQQVVPVTMAQPTSEVGRVTGGRPGSQNYPSNSTATV